MIKFPLTIDIFKNHQGMWRAHTCDVGLDVSCLGVNKEEALGAVFLALKHIPGFHLWTFNIHVSSEDVAIPTAIPGAGFTPSNYEMDLFKTHGKIAALKAYRERTGMGLREGKEAIEKEAAELGIKAP